MPSQSASPPAPPAGEPGLPSQSASPPAPPAGEPGLPSQSASPPAPPAGEPGLPSQSASPPAPPAGEPRGTCVFLGCTHDLQRAHLPLPMGEVPQCAHWGGEGNIQSPNNTPHGKTSLLFPRCRLTYLFLHLMGILYCYVLLHFSNKLCSVPNYQ